MKKKIYTVKEVYGPDDFLTLCEIFEDGTFKAICRWNDGKSCFRRDIQRSLKKCEEAWQAMRRTNKKFREAVVPTYGAYNTLYPEAFFTLGTITEEQYSDFNKYRIDYFGEGDPWSYKPFEPNVVV